MSGIKKIGDWKFKQNLRKLQAAKINMPLIIGNEAVNHFKEGFVSQGGQTDASEGGWKPREYTRKTRSGKVSKSNSSNILVKSGALKRSIRIIKKTWSGIVIGSVGLKYVSIHNFGLKGRAWGKYDFTMPKREFIGKSAKLRKRILWLIKMEMKLIMK